jgi:hypothetical protein
MKTYYFKLIFMFSVMVTNRTIGQTNLFKNGDFEVTNPNYSCHYNYLNSPNFYIIPGPVRFISSPNQNGSPDYFNSCVKDTTGNNYPGIWSLDVPYNVRGFQEAKSGSGYIGFVNWLNFSDAREYITLDLRKNLNPEKSYYFEVAVNQSAWFGFFSNDIAALFHDSLINEPGISTLQNFIPQIINDSDLIDTLKWKIFSGNFSSNGGENYVTIGNFKHYLNNPDTLRNPWWNLSPSWLLNDPNNWDKGNYIFLDDAWLIEKPEIDLQDTLITCFGDSVELKADTIGLWPGIQARWEPSTNLNNPNVFTPLALPNQTTTYYLTLQDTGRFANALAGIVDSITVVVNSDFKNITLSNDTLVCVGDTLLLNANCLDCGAVSYQWQPYQLFVDSNTNPAMFVAAIGAEVKVNLESNEEKVCLTGNHPINISIKNEADCIDLDSDKVIIPNSVNPGEFWILSGLENPEVSIWDARGRLIYFNNDYKNDFVAKEAQGIYFYFVKGLNNIFKGKLFISSP